MLLSVKEYYKFFLSNFLFTQTHLYSFFTSNEKMLNSLPKISIQANIKYSPQHFSLKLLTSKSFFIFFLKLKKSIMQISHSKVLLKNFYFFQNPKSTLKFRKRKNIYFNCTLFSKISYSFFDFLIFLDLFINLKTFFEKAYNLYCFDLFCTIKADVIILHIFNLH